MIESIPTIEIVLVSTPVVAARRKLVSRVRVEKPTLTAAWVGSKRQLKKTAQGFQTLIDALPVKERDAFYARIAQKRRESFKKHRIRPRRRKHRTPRWTRCTSSTRKVGT